MESLSVAFFMSVVSTCVSGVFAAMILRRWWQKRKPHHLAWGVGMTLYCLGTFSQVVLALTWSPLFFGLWYWSGAIMVAAWLGQGTVFLLWRKGNIARNIMMALILVGIMTLPWTLFFTPLNSAAWHPGADMTQIYKQVMPPGRGTVRSFSAVMNIWGTIALVGGAIYSSILFRRKHIMRNRMIGNWLIAAGGLMPALAGALILLGDASFKYLGEMIGAILIFAGYLMATTVPAGEEDVKPARPASESAGD